MPKLLKRILDSFYIDNNAPFEELKKKFDFDYAVIMSITLFALAVAITALIIEIVK
jgi:uncharacterized membrane protein (DUF485 family)